MSIGIRKTFNLDMVPGGAPPVIHVSAEDVGRPYRANLLYSGETYDLEDVTSVVIRGTKPDKTVFEYALTFDTEDSHVDFNIKKQMAIIAGQVLCEIRLYSGEDTIGSANFILDVETAVYDPEAASESYIPSFETAIEEALENVADDIADRATAAAINDVKQYSDAASASATAAAGSATSAQTSAGTATTAAESATSAAEEAEDAADRAEAAAESIASLESDISDLQTAVEEMGSNSGLIAPENTTFVKRALATRSSTTFEEIDPNYITYSGKTFLNDGRFLASSAYSSYAFVCPFNNFVIDTNANRVCIANSYPDENAGTVDIKDVLNYDDATVKALTIPKKGDIVVLSVGSATDLLLLSVCANPAKIDNLYLTENNDNFLKYSVHETGISKLGNEKLNITKVTGMLANASTAGYDANASYTSWYFKVTVPTLTIKCTNGFRAVIGYEEPSATSQATNLKQLVYQYAAGLVETFTAVYGDWVIISVANSTGDIDLQTDYLTAFEMPGLKLSYKQANSFYRYVASGAEKRLYIYLKSGKKYVQYELHNVPAAIINSNTWQIGAVYGLDEDLSNPVELVAGGEFELALKEHGAADFCGGNNHGDETTDEFHLFIDGKLISDLSTLNGDYTPFNRIDAVEIATVNRCDKPSEDIAKHQKVWAFENGTVKVKQSINFLEQLQIDGMLICMLAANRSAFGYGVRNDKVGVETMTTSTYNVTRTRTNNAFYELFGDNATAKVSAKPFDNASVSGLWINPTSVLNKLYYTYWENSNSTFPVTVNANDTLYWESEYDIAYN